MSKLRENFSINFVLVNPATYIITVLTSLLIISTLACANTDKITDPVRTADEKVADALSGIPYTEMLYSKIFQSRFSLPEKGIANLDENLLAIAIELVPSSSDGKFLQCGLHLYVDSEKVKLDLMKPDSGFNPNSSTLNNNFFTYRYPLNENDSAFRMMLMKDFSSRLMIKSDTYPKGVINLESLQNYTVDIFPGITHFAFNPPCGSLYYKNLGEAHFWLNKTSNSKNLPDGNSKGNSQLFYQFTMPSRLSRSFESVIEKINAINAKNRDKFFLFMQKYRELLNTEKGFTIPAK